MSTVQFRLGWIAAALLLFAGLLPAAGFAQLPLGVEPAAEDADAPAEDEVEILLRVLEDDAARERLVERLRDAGAAAGDDAAAVEDDRVTLADRLAAYTRDAADSTARFFEGFTALVDRITDVSSGAVAVDFDQLRETVLDVAVIVVATFAVYFFLRLILRSVQRRLARAAAEGDMMRRVKRIGGSVVLDVATVTVSWAVGYGIAIGFGASRNIALDQSLFLNAFLIVELIKAACRTVMSPQFPALRPIRLDDTTSAYWYFWLSRLISLIGYTFLFIAPILANGVSSDFAEAARIIAMLTALVIAIAVVLQNRETVRMQLARRAAAGRSDPLSRLLASVGRVWHLAVIGYLVVVFSLWLSSGETALPFVLAATGNSIVAIVLGAIVTTFISRMASGGMRLPADVRARLPLLESRLNAFVPAVLRVVRAIVSIAVIITLIQVWRIADVGAWLSSPKGIDFIAGIVSAALILLIGGIVYLVGQTWIEYRLNPNLGRVITSRERTLLGLFRNAFTVVLGVLVFMLVLDQIGVSIGPLIAGAGVVGLAIGFGAQKLVQDVINGVFIQFENTMNEGDVVSLGGISGVVERLTIRSVSLRSLDGTYHMIPFSSVDTVSNMMKHFSYHIAAIGVSYRENMLEVKEAMTEAFTRLMQTEHAANIIGEFEMHGVNEFATSSVVVRGRIKTLPGQQWGVGRAYNEIVKQVFDERGIQIAVPHMTVYFGEDRQGNAPPVRVQSLEAPAESPASA